MLKALLMSRCSYVQNYDIGTKASQFQLVIARIICFFRLLHYLFIIIYLLLFKSALVYFKYTQFLTGKSRAKTNSSRANKQ